MSFRKLPEDCECENTRNDWTPQPADTSRVMVPVPGSETQPMQVEVVTPPVN